jgi:hypothetical protein
MIFRILLGYLLQILCFVKALALSMPVFVILSECEPDGVFGKIDELILNLLLVSKALDEGQAVTHAGPQ